MESYIERHISFGVDEFEGLWKLQFLHPFFFADTKRVVTVYIVPSNSDYTDSEYNGYEVVDAGPHLTETIKKLIPMIQNYPYRWELEGKKLDTYGYDFVSGMSKSSDMVNSIDLTDIAFAEVNRYYDFTEAVDLPEVVTEDESIERDAALVKISVTLEKAQWTNQLSLDFFTAYPIEIVSVMYQEDSMKYSASYEIPLAQIQKSASSSSILFPSVFAKKFILVLAQSTYTVGNFSNKDYGVDISEQLSDVISLISDSDNQWADEVIGYEKRRLEREANWAYDTSYNDANAPEWRPEYTAARNKENEQMILYKQRLMDYQEAESKYKKEMAEYVRYQQQLADWYQKWG